MTLEEGTQKQIPIYRAMTPQERVQISFDLYELTRILAGQGVKHRHLNWGEEQVEQEV